MKTPASDHIEDIEDAPIEVGSVLSDEALIDGGLVPIRAYARTRSSKAALRAKRHRERVAAGQGDAPPRKQLNVMAPLDEDARNAVKQVAEALIEGRIKPADTQRFGDNASRLGKAVQSILDRGGIRAMALRVLIGQHLR